MNTLQRLGVALLAVALAWLGILVVNTVSQSQSHAGGDYICSGLWPRQCQRYLEQIHCLNHSEKRYSPCQQG